MSYELFVLVFLKDFQKRFLCQVLLFNVHLSWFIGLKQFLVSNFFIEKKQLDFFFKELFLRR